MIKRLFILCICCAIFTFTLLAVNLTPPFLLSNSLCLAQEKTEFRESVRKFRRLISEHQLQGIDVSQARELGRESRDATMKGNREKAARLLDEAIHILETGTGKSLTAGQTSQEYKRPKKNKYYKIELPVSEDKVFITPSVAEIDSGEKMGDYVAAFRPRPVEVKNGKVTLELSTLPIFVEEDGIQSDTFTALESPFGIHGIASWETNLKELGIQWIRYAGRQGVVWDLAEPEKGRFDWASYDRLFQKTFKNNTEMLITVKGANSWDQRLKSERELGKRKSRKRPESKLPNNLKDYSNFLQKMVERYDGDGKDDAAWAPIIRYWQIENEVDGGHYWRDTPQNYAVLLKTAYKAIKAADPSAKVVLAGVMSREGFHKFYLPMLEHLNKIKDHPADRYFDIFDFHWGGPSGSYKKTHRRGVDIDFKQYIEEIQSTLKRYDFTVPIWITEISTYSGHPESPHGLKEQAEEAQAAELVKLYVYPLALGVKKVFWVSLTEWGNFGGRQKGYFNMVGIISNPRNERGSHKKLAYYSYRNLIEKLGGTYLDKVQSINLGENIYCFKFIKKKNGKFIYVLWHDGLTLKVGPIF